MNNAVLTALCCIWIAVFGTLMVYSFQAPREWALSLLVNKERISGAAVIAALPHLAATSGVAPLAQDTYPSPLAASSTAAAPAIAQPADIGYCDTTPTPPPPPPTYEYKIQESVDPCKLTKLGADGWVPIQFGNGLISVGGFDASCTTRGTYTGLDWALFSRTKAAQ